MLGSKTAIFAIWLVLMSQIGCSTAPLEPHHGKEVYSEVGMWVERERHLTNNYRKGTFIPANSKLVIHSSTETSVRVRIPGERVQFSIINNYPDNLTTQEIYDRYFSENPLDLDELRDFEVEAIRNGEVVEGMTKQAVLHARGYPPPHRTPSVEHDEWIYWEKMGDNSRVYFENDQVKHIIH